MCKILAILGGLPMSHTAVAVDTASMLFRKGQLDGFGFVAAGPDSIAYGRYFNPEAFYGWRDRRNTSEPCSETGELPQVASCILLHGRTATNSKTLENCHPFRVGGKYMVHNGVLDWIGGGDPPKSAHGCDTEMFMRWMISTKHWQYHCKDNWAGYGAMILYDDSTRMTTLVVDDTASMNLVRREKGGYILGTESSQIMTASNVTRIRVRTRPIRVRSAILTFDSNGELHETMDFDGFAPRRYDSLFSASIGHSSGTVTVSTACSPTGEVKIYGNPDHPAGTNAKPLKQAPGATSKGHCGRRATRERFPDYDPHDRLQQMIWPYLPDPR